MGKKSILEMAIKEKRELEQFEESIENADRQEKEEVARKLMRKLKTVENSIEFMGSNKILAESVLEDIEDKVNESRLIRKKVELLNIELPMIEKIGADVEKELLEEMNRAKELNIQREFQYNRITKEFIRNFVEMLSGTDLVDFSKEFLDATQKECGRQVDKGKEKESKREEALLKEQLAEIANYLLRSEREDNEESEESFEVFSNFLEVDDTDDVEMFTQKIVTKADVLIKRIDTAENKFDEALEKEEIDVAIEAVEEYEKAFNKLQEHVMKNKLKMTFIDEELEFISPDDERYELCDAFETVKRDLVGILKGLGYDM